MGFEVNFNNKPIIKEAQSMQNDGGAGNLGYFEQDKEKEKEKQKNSSIFAEQEGDTFKSSADIDEPETDFSISKLIAEAILAVKNFFKKIFG